MYELNQFIQCIGKQNCSCLLKITHETFSVFPNNTMQQKYTWKNQFFDYTFRIEKGNSPHWMIPVTQKIGFEVSSVK